MQYIPLDSSLIQTLYIKDQLSSSQIAQQLGVSQNKILSELHKLGCHIRRQPSRADFNINEIIRLYNDEKMSSRQVATALNYKDSTVRSIIKDSGVSRNRKEALKLAESQGRIPHPIGKDNPKYKGGTRSTSGYIFIHKPNHPRANHIGYVRRSWLVWEEVHNKPLPENWVVHHLNGIKTDDRPRNLLGLPKDKHHGFLVQQAIQHRIREMEVENRQLLKALENSQAIFYINEN